MHNLYLVSYTSDIILATLQYDLAILLLCTANMDGQLRLVDNSGNSDGVSGNRLELFSKESGEQPVCDNLFALMIMMLMLLAVNWNF